MEEEVVVHDVFKTASSAQKSLTWKHYLISTINNTTQPSHKVLLLQCCDGWNGATYAEVYVEL
jgi:hypothetical protein